MAISIGVLLWGWLVGAMPTEFSTAVAFERSIPADVSDMDHRHCIAELLATRNLDAAMRSMDYGPDRINDRAEWLRSRSTVSAEPINERRQRIIVRVRCATPQESERLGRALVDQFLAGKSTNLSAAALTKAMNVAEEKVRIESEALAAAQSALTTARQNAEKVWHAQQAMLQQSLDGLRATLAGSSADKIQTVASIPPLSESGATVVAASEDTLVHQALRDAHRRRAEIIATFTDKHPSVRALDRKIRELATTAGIKDVGEWIRQSSMAERQRQTPNASTSTDGSVIRAAAERIDSPSIVQQIAQVEAKLAEHERRPPEDPEVSRCVANVQRLQGKWHDAMAWKRDLAEQLASESSAQVERFRRIPRLLDAVRAEGPDRRAWFLGGAFLWICFSGAATIRFFRHRQSA